MLPCTYSFYTTLSVALPSLKKLIIRTGVTLGPTAQLTLLLLTGRATDSLQDFLGGGGKLTDRVSGSDLRARDVAILI